MHDDVQAVVRPNRASGARGSGSRFSIVAVVSPSGSRPYEALDSVSVSSPSSCASSSSETSIGPDREPWALTTNEVRDWLAKSREMKVQTDEPLPLEVKLARRSRP